MNKPIDEQNCGNCRYQRRNACRFRTPEVGEDGLATWPEMENPGAEWCKQWKTSEVTIAERRAQRGLPAAWAEAIEASEGKHMAKADLLNLIIGLHKGKRPYSRDAARALVNRAIDNKTLIETRDLDADILWISVAPAEDELQDGEARQDKSPTSAHEPTAAEMRMRVLGALSDGPLFWRDVHDAVALEGQTPEQTQELLRSMAKERVIAADAKGFCRSLLLPGEKSSPPAKPIDDPEPYMRDGPVGEVPPITLDQLRTVNGRFDEWKNAEEHFLRSLAPYVAPGQNRPTVLAALAVWESEGYLIRCGTERWKRGPNLAEACEEADDPDFEIEQPPGD